MFGFCSNQQKVGNVEGKNCSTGMRMTIYAQFVVARTSSSNLQIHYSNSLLLTMLLLKKSDGHIPRTVQCLSLKLWARGTIS